MAKNPIDKYFTEEYPWWIKLTALLTAIVVYGGLIAFVIAVFAAIVYFVCWCFGITMSLKVLAGTGACCVLTRFITR